MGMLDADLIARNSDSFARSPASLTQSSVCLDYGDQSVPYRLLEEPVVIGSLESSDEHIGTSVYRTVQRLNIMRYLYMLEYLQY